MNDSPFSSKTLVLAQNMAPEHWSQTKFLLYWGFVAKNNNVHFCLVILKLCHCMFNLDWNRLRQWCQILFALIMLCSALKKEIRNVSKPFSFALKCIFDSLCTFSLLREGLKYIQCALKFYASAILASFSPLIRAKKDLCIEVFFLNNRER